MLFKLLYIPCLWCAVLHISLHFHSFGVELLKLCPLFLQKIYTTLLATSNPRNVLASFQFAALYLFLMTLKNLNALFFKQTVMYKLSILFTPNHASFLILISPWTIQHNKQKSSPSLRIVMWGSSSASGRRRMTIKSSSGYFFVLHQRFFTAFVGWMDGATILLVFYFLHSTQNKA